MISIRSHRYKISFLLVLYLSLVNVSAQLIMGADARAMGQAVTAERNFAWGLYANPASMVQEGPAISFFSLRNYGLSELTDLAASYSTNIKEGIAGLGIHRYGNDLYKEYNLYSGYAYGWGSFRAGVALHYKRIAFGGSYPSMASLALNTGVSYRLSERVNFGARVTNLNQARIGSSNEMDARELAVGLSYLPEEGTRLNMDVVKDVRFPLSWRGGLETEILQEVFARVGLTTKPNTISGGFGLQRTGWKVNMAFERHEYLGISPAIDLNVYW